MKKNIAYLGPEWTYSHIAALRYLQNTSSSSYRLVPMSTIAHALYAVDQGDALLAIVPAENSIEGTVNVTMDVLTRDLTLNILGEVILEITHHLMTFASSLDKIKTVTTHPQAMAQCRGFLTEKLSHAEMREAKSTSEAISTLCPQNPEAAAIGSWDSHINYQVPILTANIGDYSNNKTRFLLVGKEALSCAHTSKTSLALALDRDRPGGLYEVLGEFASRSINLSRIESRPAKKELGNYIFLIDCEAGHDNPLLQDALQQLEAKTVWLKNLGSYNTI